ncbi:TonB-dependent siderophore receptor [Steroidobacter flavus]|uniref:TonB-dependent siderophore receptor n=1 Tax=Steroidobacter flavus TaxID=1842136 RepID=A0ABV8T468_9GAMM
MSHSSHRLRAFIVAALACTFSSIAPLTPAQAQQPVTDLKHKTSFNIPAGDLVRALRDFAEASGFQLVYSTEMTANAKTAGASGSMSVPEALERLLAGTGLRYRLVGQKTVSIERDKTNGTRTLGPVRVEGADRAAVNGINGSRDITATESTGSFTSGALTIGSKAPQAIKEVPQSLSVITAQRMEEQNITDFNQALAQTPGITLVQGVTSLQNTFYSRGFEITSIQIDGGPPLKTGFGFYPQIDMAQYDHVEILRGATGVLNGYGGPSGSINLVRKKPLDRPQVATEVQAGSWDNYRAVLDASAPLTASGGLRGRAIVTYQDNRYFYDVAEDNKTLLYGIVEYDLTSSTLINAGISHTRENSVPWYGGLPRYQNGDDLKLPRHTSFVFPWNHWDFETTEVFAALEQKLGNDWTAKLTVTRNEQESKQKFGYASGPVNPLTNAGPLLTGFFTDYASDQLATEATFFGGIELFGQRQEITLGFNYVDTNGGGRKGYESLIAGSSTVPYQPYPGGPTYYTGSPNGARPPIDVFNFDPNDALYAEPRDPLPNQRVRGNGNIQYGSYLNLRLTAFDRWHLNAGIRYSYYRSRLHSDNLCSSIPTSGTPAANNCVGRQIGDPILPTDQEYDDNDLTWPPAVSLSYDVRSDLTAYVGYTDIYESQAKFLDRDLEPVAPITGSNIEAGLKWQARDGALNATLAAYRISREDFARVDPSSYARNPDGSINTSIRVDNAGNRYSRGTVAPGIECCYLTSFDISEFSQGVDLEIAGEVLPGWQVAAGYTFNENEYRGADLALYKDDATEGTVLRSQQPEHLFKLWTSYRLPDERWTRGLTVSGGVQAQSKAFLAGSACAQLGPPNSLGVSSCATGQNIPYSYTQSAYAVWSARLDYDVARNWSIALNINNLTDTRYYKTTGSSSSGNWYGEPRSFLVSIRSKW